MLSPSEAVGKLSSFHLWLARESRCKSLTVSGDTKSNLLLFDLAGCGRKGCAESKWSCAFLGTSLLFLCYYYSEIISSIFLSDWVILVLLDEAVLVFIFPSDEPNCETLPTVVLGIGAATAPGCSYRLTL